MNRSKCLLATSQNCNGSTTKKASTRLRWSPRRVGERVMNSRSAKNASSANSTVATVSPSTQPIQKTEAITHDAFNRLRNRRSSSASASSSTEWLAGARSERKKAQTLTPASRPNITMKSAPTCCVALRLRKKLFMSGTVWAGRRGRKSGR